MIKLKLMGVGVQKMSSFLTNPRTNTYNNQNTSVYHLHQKDMHSSICKLQSSKSSSNLRQGKKRNKSMLKLRLNVKVVRAKESKMIILKIVKTS